jgi:hypothetical protein
MALTNCQNVLKGLKAAGWTYAGFILRFNQLAREAVDRAAFQFG